MEQRREGGQERVEDRDATRAGEGTHRVRELGGDVQPDGRPAIGTDRRAGAVGGQFEPRKVKPQLLPPPRPEALALRAGEPPLLPAHEVGIRGRRRQLHGRDARLAVVERPEIARQDRQRPIVRHQVMDYHHQQRAAWGPPENPDAKGWTRFEVERPRDLPAQPLLQLHFVPTGGVDVEEAAAQPGMHPLDRLPCPSVERGA